MSQQRIGKTTDVIIIGAGPTGLSLACQLERYGVDYIIVDAGDTTTRDSRAVGVQARTLEIYEQIGLAQPAVDQGTIAQAVRFVVGGTVRGELDLTHIGEGLSAYPYLLMIEQSKTERLLNDYVRTRGGEVHWRTSFSDLHQTDAGVEARLQSSSGDVSSVVARYLVGCDGAKSAVRQALSLSFEGTTFERMFYVADVNISWAFGHDALYVCLGKDFVLIFFPLKVENRYRIVGTFPESLEKDEGDVLYEEIEREIQTKSRLELDISDVNWFSTYKVHTRHVTSFSAGRCFLAGDAAHIHSPVGAQGMNTGIQDAYNLAWKLAYVLGGKAHESILDSYNTERLENAKHLLRTTDRVFQFGAGSDPILAFIRTEIMPHVANTILNIEAVKQYVFPLVSQIGVAYHHSPLSYHESDRGFAVKAGDRMPYFLVDGASIYNRLRSPRFHLVQFSSRGENCSEPAPCLDIRLSDMIDVTMVPLRTPVDKIFGTDKPFSVFLRPDNYIGSIYPDSPMRAANDYLSHISIDVPQLQVADQAKAALR